METVRFLRDIENETKYAQGLEIAYLDAFEALNDLCRRMYGDVQDGLSNLPNRPIDERHKELRHVLFVMGLVIRDCTERRKRLADVAAGLSDVVFDEESP